MIFSKRFFPLFICQFLGALNDNIFRLALVAMLAFGHLESANNNVIIQLAAAIFIIPFFLLSIYSGEIIDKCDKKRLLLRIKLAEIIIMIIAGIGIHYSSLHLILLCLFFTGVQSAFFGPLKFSLLPELLGQDRLIQGNSIFTSSTIAAIILGVIIGTAGGSEALYFKWVIIALISNSIIGYIMAYFVPISAPTAIPTSAPTTTTAQESTIPTKPIITSPWRSFSQTMGKVADQQPIFNLIICGSFFWGVCTVLLAELPQVGKEFYQYVLGCLFLGAGLGAIACTAFLRGKISTQYSIKNLAIGIVAMLIMAWSFKKDATQFPFIFSLALILFTGALTFYIVPIISSIQAHSETNTRARTIAVYNVWNAIFIVTCSVIAAVINVIVIEKATPSVLLFGVTLLLIALIWSLFILPRANLQTILKSLLTRLYRVEIHGLENLNPNETPLIVCNHSSTLDGPLLSTFLENDNYRMIFVVTSAFDNYPFAKSIGNRLAYICKIDSFNPRALRTLIKDIRKKQSEPQDDTFRPMIFPEGRITTTGVQMHIYDGAALLLDKVCNHQILPITIEGLQNSTHSYLQDKFPRLAFPKVTITIGKIQTITPPQTFSRLKEKRRWISKKIERILEEQTLQGKTPDLNLTQFFINNMQKHGKKRNLFADVYPARQLSYLQCYRGAWVLGKKIADAVASNPPKNTATANNIPPTTTTANIGLLLPSSVGAAVSFYGTAFYGLVPVMLNPTSGAAQLTSVCQTAQINIVFTAKALMEKLADAEAITQALKQNNIQLIYLEDLRTTITTKDKLGALFASTLLKHASKKLPGYATPKNHPGCILFTSGSEGFPKGVVLSHHNLIHNCTQILIRIAATHQDSMLNTLPVFHAFGLIAGIILPVATGMKTAHYPSPLHYRLVPEAIYATNATIFFSTNTFLKNYAKYAHACAFYNLTKVFAGAEKLEDSTKELWMNNFGIRILEGYGATETAPVIAVNSPLRYRAQSVGLPLAGIETDLQTVEGIDHGKCLWVRGKNNMLGYYLASQPGIIQPLKNNWYNTGDIVTIDTDGYITIVGRQKRFVKVAGEMVPLNRIETVIKLNWQHAHLAVVGIPDERRGEKIILVSTIDITRKELTHLFAEQGLPNLWLPRDIAIVKNIPLLHNGKTDYVAMTQTMIEQAKPKNDDEDDEDADAKYAYTEDGDEYEADAEYGAEYGKDNSKEYSDK